MPERIVTYLAMAFRRSDHEITHDDPISPIGGSFLYPVPSNGEWSRVPLPGNDPLYITLRIFTSDGLFPQEDDWSPPVIFVKNGLQGDVGASAAPAINGVNGLDGMPGDPGEDITLDMTIPPAPTGLITLGAFNSILIKWDAATYGNHAYTEIWRNTVDDRLNSELVGMSPGAMYSDIPPDTKLANEYYYWIRFISTSGIIGPYNAPDGIVATTANDPAHMIDLLSKSLDAMATSNVFGTTQIVIPAETFAIKGTAVAGGVGEDTPAVYPFIVARTPMEIDPPGGPYTGDYAVFMDTAYITNLTATNFVGQTIVADIVSVGVSIDSPVVTGGEFTGSSFTGGTFTGGVVQTATSGKRTVIYASDYADADLAGEIHVYDNLASSGGSVEEIASIGLNQSGVDTCIGVFGSQATNNNKVGIKGLSRSAAAVMGNSVSGYGVYATSATGYGISAYSESSIGISSNGSIGVLGSGSTGVQGEGGVWNFYANGAGSSGDYGSFTGAHDGLALKEFIAEVGDIVVDLSTLWKKNVSNTVALNGLSNEMKQKNALGVLVNVRGLEPLTAGISLPYPWPEDYSLLYDAIIVNGLGEGQINVCKDGGNIQAGDYICSSNRAGKGMKQDDDLLHNYTVAKAREDCIWLEGEDDIRMVACSYHCG